MSDAISHVSVIVPVYNDRPGVLACLEGMRRQTYPLSDIEVILVDNGSNPPLVIDTVFPFRLRIQQCETPGSYAARNSGAHIASGTILAFTDADCIPSADWIKRGTDALAAGDGRYVIGGEVRMLEPGVRTGVALYQYVSGFQQQKNIEQKGFAVTANLFCTASQFRDVGGFEEQLLSGGDREWAWRATQRGFAIRFEADAVVSTHPRTSLAAAIRQARRTSAGRFHLRKYAPDHGRSGELSPHRSSMYSILWILTRRQYSLYERIRMLFAAILIKSAALVEKVRLSIGTSPERR